MSGNEKPKSVFVTGYCSDIDSYGANNSDDDDNDNDNDDDDQDGVDGANT